MVNFCKFEGFGNDYLVIAADELRAPNIGDDMGEFARKICGRENGVATGSSRGSDGLAVWEKIESAPENTTKNTDADFSVRIINPDGSEAGFSGNGTRCAVAYFYYKKLWANTSLKLSTLSGIKKYTLIEEISPGHYWFDAEIGKPKFAAADIPMTLDGSPEVVTDLPLETSEGLIRITALNVGNPVCVIFLKNFESYDWRKLGAEIETHKLFPERTNVVFVKVQDLHNIEVRIWERGAGETSSSGTCSVAAAVASAFTWKTERNVAVHAPGGTTEVVWREDGEMLLKGRADLVACGEYDEAL